MSVSNPSFNCKFLSGLSSDCETLSRRDLAYQLENFFSFQIFRPHSKEWLKKTMPYKPSNYITLFSRSIIITQLSFDSYKNIWQALIQQYVTGNWPHALEKIVSLWLNICFCRTVPRQKCVLNQRCLWKTARLSHVPAASY